MNTKKILVSISPKDFERLQVYLALEREINPHLSVAAFCRLIIKRYLEEGDENIINEI